MVYRIRGIMTMPRNKKQMFRLHKFIGQLKENRYPNCVGFAAELRRLDLDDNQNLACTAKTIQRDIKTLREEFQCPLEFDHDRNGYYLKHHGWNFNLPDAPDENSMLAAVLGARIAEDIFPEPLRGDVRNAVDRMLSIDNPDFLDRTIVKSLTVIPGLRSPINATVFMTVYTAWQEHEAIDIVYLDVHGNQTRRLVEPHALVYYECSWYFKGHCLLREEVRNFAVHRIVRADKTGRFFEPDFAIIDSVLHDRFLDYAEVTGIEWRCDNSIKSHLVGNPLHREQEIVPDGDTRFRLCIPALPEHEIVQWTLYQAGAAEILTPPELRQKVVEASRVITQKHEKQSRRS